MDPRDERSRQEIAALLTIAATNLMGQGLTLEEASNAAFDIFKSLIPCVPAGDKGGEK